MKKQKQEIIAETRRWLEQFVIGLELCPFAKVPYERDLVRLVVHRTDSMSEWIKVLYDEMHKLDQTPSDLLSNTLLIFSKGPADFLDFLDLVEMAKITLQDQQLDKTIQLAHFHPEYTFAEREAGHISHYTNRSPYPMLHLLRVAEVSEAIAGHPDIDSVGPLNVQKMEKLGIEGIQDLLKV